MNPALGQPPKKETINSAERETAGFSSSACTINIVENPADFGRREIRIEPQTGLFRHPRLVTLALERSTIFRSSTVLPNDCVVNALAGRPIPHHSRFPLVGNTDSRHISGTNPGVLHRVCCH